MTSVTRAPPGHFGHYNSAQIEAMATNLVGVASRVDGLYGERVRGLHEEKRAADEDVAALEGNMQLAPLRGQPVTNDMVFALARARGRSVRATQALESEQRALRPLVDAEIRGVSANPDRVLRTITAETERDARAEQTARSAARRNAARAEWLSSFDARTSTAQALWQLRRLRGDTDRPGQIILSKR